MDLFAGGMLGEGLLTLFPVCTPYEYGFCSPEVRKTLMDYFIAPSLTTMCSRYSRNSCIVCDMILYYSVYILYFTMKLTLPLLTNGCLLLLLVNNILQVAQ